MTLASIFRLNPDARTASSSRGVVGNNQSYGRQIATCFCAIAGVISVNAQPVVVWFDQNYNGLHLFKIDVNQTIDNGVTLTASSTPYFADIGEMPLPTNIASGDNRIVATGWYTDSNNSTMLPMVLVTNVTGAGIEMIGTNGASFQSSSDMVHWTPTNQPSPFIVPMDKEHEFFRPINGTLAAVFGSTPLPVQYLVYQDTNVIQSTSTPMIMP